MTPLLSLLIELQDLLLLRRSLELTQPHSTSSIETLDKKMQKLRHRIPGRILSEFDRMAHDLSDPVVPVLEGICLGCKEPINAQLSHQLENSGQPARCSHCNRFIFAQSHAPKYIGTKVD